MVRAPGHGVLPTAGSTGRGRTQRSGPPHWESTATWSSMTIHGLQSATITFRPAGPDSTRMKAVWCRA